jgi:glycine/D-amino acid oxidase-like deaminating enzyme
MHDAIVIGGGFYGCVIAIHLKAQLGFRNVVLIEREPGLMRRASYNNQARVHNGYHYPRSFTTAFRSRVNLPHFLQDFPQAIRRDFTSVYAIARRNSRVTARQFERFCRDIGASLAPAPDDLRKLFEPRLIEEVFLAEEYAFDADKLAEWAREKLVEWAVEVRLSSRVGSISTIPDGLGIELQGCQGSLPETLSARYVFNCTYSGLHQFSGQFTATQTPLKHEITEMALMQVPASLANFGITVMDGPFFSLMPFPARGLHTLSHVRYTPHCQWPDWPGCDPYQKLEAASHATRVDRMLRDAARYLPAIADAKYVESMFEVKTVLLKNEGDDGRPILFEKHTELPGCYSILGGKIDNIYDVLEKLDAERLTDSRP